MELNGAGYELKAVVVHNCELVLRGHFSVIVRSCEEGGRTVWTCCSDSSIVRISEAEMLRRSTGGVQVCCAEGVLGGVARRVRFARLSYTRARGYLVLGVQTRLEFDDGTVHEAILPDTAVLLAYERLAGLTAVDGRTASSPQAQHAATVTGPSPAERDRTTRDRSRRTTPIADRCEAVGQRCAYASLR